jgi:uncharacterized membrane protein/glutaredoxin
LNELSIPVTETSIFLELEKHPQQFSMLAINEVLNTFQVNNGAYHVETQDLSEDFCPFIAHLSRNDGEFITVRQIMPTSVIFSSESAKKEILSRETFDSYFTGAILVADNESRIEEPNYKAKKRSEIVGRLKLPFLFVCFVIISSLYVFQNLDYFRSFTIGIILWGLVKISGLMISILLIIQNIDANNSFIKRLCTAGKKADCNAILTSKAAKITDELSWSEVGFFYFTSTTLTLLFYGNSIALLQTLVILNVLSLPYTTYSIYYQYAVAKKWCVLCTTTQAILWLEFFSSFYFLLRPLSRPSLNDILGLSILFILPIAGWVFIKPFLLSKRQVNTVKDQLNTFKKDVNLFNSILVAQGRSEMPEKDNSIILGSADPKKIITIASSPTCQPCAKAHKILEKWLHADETLQVRIIYTAGRENPEGIDYKVARQITSLNLSKSDMLDEAVHEWYSIVDKDPGIWISKFSGSSDAEGAELVLRKQAEWCSAVKIVQTPTIFINGYKLPDPYKLEDIRYLI